MAARVRHDVNKGFLNLKILSLKSALNASSPIKDILNEPHYRKLFPLDHLLLIATLPEGWGLLNEPLIYLSGYLKYHQTVYFRRPSGIRTDGNWE